MLDGTGGEHRMHACFLCACLFRCVVIDDVITSNLMTSSLPGLIPLSFPPSSGSGSSSSEGGDVGAGEPQQQVAWLFANPYKFTYYRNGEVAGGMGGAWDRYAPDIEIKLEAAVRAPPDCLPSPSLCLPISPSSLPFPLLL